MLVISEGKKLAKMEGLRANKSSEQSWRAVLFTGDGCSRWEQQGVRKEREEVKESRS